MPCAVRTVWRPWTCTRARPPRALTGLLPHDAGGRPHPPALLQGLRGSARTLGLGVFSGSYFLRHVTFVSTEAPFPAAGAPGRGSNAAHKACLILPDCQHCGGTSLPGQDRQLGGKGVWRGWGLIPVSTHLDVSSFWSTWPEGKECPKGAFSVSHNKCSQLPNSILLSGG